MSHFFTIILLPNYTDNINKEIESLMSKYSEELRVPEYDEVCWCVKSQQRKLKNQQVEKETGMSWETAREKFNALYTYEKVDKKTSVDKMLELLDKQEADWKEFTKPLTETECKYNSNDFPAKPDSDCTSCNGIGTNKSTYNPNSKWDWYVVGGRYDGYIQNAPNNDGHGNYGDEHHKIINNLSDIAKLKQVIPYAIVTPDGEWYERGRMGWFGVSTDDKCINVWETVVHDIYKKYNDHIAVGLDCHI